ncbi:DNA-directed RNA polymerase III subunit RPC8 (RNA polymerase III subunit C8) (DNA-directed RNA polymerase III subunit H) (RNA polymerase III subunit 22.9 kDa subunit) (RPC22.9) [Durusdinium trenchii]|uniref:DNA-directed RNA polymerase III subunit RPC8 (RNA polymerase III subunit C8) (DNA-directed RNA polymerase III subunit H) (RNA polymerase III subunit 22.9 kDa subunit) (RPC22.9) n=1 Tax=Durusdinium trenchii TaxID=1381693 RepID=A0ABP0NZV8_9DINO
MIYPGDGKHSCGEAYVKVEFQLIVFQPLVDEWLVGSVSGSTQRGLQISLGFFQDVEIPSANLRTPYMYDAAQERWVWLYQDEDTKESVNYFYEKDQLIRFRVTHVHFPEGKQRKPMSIVGAVDRDGLGLVEWWP